MLELYGSKYRLVKRVAVVDISLDGGRGGRTHARMPLYSLE
jgi:hypothetical protein